MADAYTTAGKNNDDNPQEKRKQINGFTGEEEDAPDLNLAPSPADQRILSAAPHTEPLPVLADRLVNSGNEAGLNVEKHSGPSLTSDSLPGETPLPYVPEYDTPQDNEGAPLPTQYTDVPPPNDIAREEGATVNHDGVPYPGLDVKEYSDSVNARLEAEAEGVPLSKLPEIKDPVVPEVEESDSSEEGEPLTHTQESDESDKKVSSDDVSVRATHGGGTSKDAGKTK